MVRARLLVLAVVALALAGCATGPASDTPASPGPSPTSPDRTGRPSPTSTSTEEHPMDGEWQLTGGSDATGDIVVNGVPVTLLIARGAVSGRAPCNTYTGGVSGDGGTIAFAPIEQTEIACEDDALNRLETRYLAALRASTTATVDGDSLTLGSADSTLQFTLLPRLSVD
jgi:heat shock protein HslJ